VINPRDELAFKRIARMLPGVGTKSAEKLWSCFSAALAPAPAPDAAATPSPPALATALQACTDSVPKKTVTAWAQFSATLAQLESEPVRGQPSSMINLVVEAGYDEYLKENYANYQSRIEDLEQMANFAMQFKGTEDFLTQLALLSNIEAEEERPAGGDSEQLRLSTVHQAKGLEFNVVFIIMLCDRLFPTERSLERIESEEEERRLFYVAITRAKNELYLTYPLIRMTAGYTGDIVQAPSRFFHDLPDNLIEDWNLRPYNAYA
jgi:DNA helicase-2/ATP-dependent DNA helicase PcrA